jgi:hypothetical protein
MSLNNCVLRTEDGHLGFLQPSGTVQVGNTIAAYTYKRSSDGWNAVASLSPKGGTLGSNSCLVHHALQQVGPPRASASEIIYDVVDKGTMHPCTTANRRALGEPVHAEIKAELACPRAHEPWFRAP